MSAPGTTLTAELQAVQAARMALGSKSWPREAERRLIVEGLLAVEARYGTAITRQREVAE